MNKLYFFCCLAFLNLAFVADIQAQRFSYDPSNKLEESWKANEDPYLHISILNETTDTLRFRWRLLSNDLMPQWDAALCDLNKCYISIPDSGQMDPAIPGIKDAFFSLTLSLNGIPGSGKLKLFVFEIGDEANGDTVIFSINSIALPTLLEESTAFNSEKTSPVYPNPITNYLKVEASVEVYNLAGNLMGKGSNIPTTNWPSGVYLVKFSNGIQKVIKK